MIVDNIKNAPFYYSLHPRLEKAFDFFQTIDFDLCEEETIEVDGDKIKLIISLNKLKDQAESPLEAHRKYFDVHIPISQAEVFGWKSLKSIKKEVDGYDSEKDFELFDEKPSTYFTVEPGEFTVFFAEDTHAPLIGSGEMKKIIFKILID